MKHLDIRVSGRVQGVFFRASAKQKADETGIKGFVRNEKDGSVFIEAEGTEEKLRSFIHWCKQGPPSANITSCIVSEGDLQNYGSFEIKR